MFIYTIIWITQNTKQMYKLHQFQASQICQTSVLKCHLNATNLHWIIHKSYSIWHNLNFPQSIALLLCIREFTSFTRQSRSTTGNRSQRETFLPIFAHSRSRQRICLKYSVYRIRPRMNPGWGNGGINIGKFNRLHILTPKMCTPSCISMSSN